MAIEDVSSLTLPELLSLQGRVAVITGGGRGIGAAISRRLAEAGAAIVNADLEFRRAERTASSLRDTYGASAIGVAVDVAQTASVEALCETAVATFGGVDIWVNNAAVYPTIPLMELEDEDMDRILDVNLRGTLVGARAAARAMIAQGRGGVIINLSSTAAFRVKGPGIVTYVATKRGVRGLTRALAVELGEYGIRVLDVAPTWTQPAGRDDLIGNFDQTAVGDAIRQLVKSIPLGRPAVPDDVARAVLFAASDMASMMTGSTLRVDGGDIAH
jgi:NAD(P)-dependent dehydrogenase (short-subunit alcohol dehydrogenase family)